MPFGVKGFRVSGFGFGFRVTTSDSQLGVCVAAARDGVTVGVEGERFGPYLQR